MFFYWSRQYLECSSFRHMHASVDTFSTVFLICVYNVVMKYALFDHLQQNLLQKACSEMTSSDSISNKSQSVPFANTQFLTII